MLTYPEINPVAIPLGPIKVHWYGLMYLVAFLAFWWLGKIRAKRVDIVVKPEQVEDIMFYGMLGVVLGGRLGYILFYNFSQFMADPLLIFRVWQGGMSFHGGLIGVLAAMWLYQRRYQWGFLRIMDFVAPAVPVGLMAGRIGNFINGELWGRTADVPWAMVFPSGGPLARHPSQIYQALLEGLLLFVVLWVFSSKQRPVGAVSALFLIGYGAFRFFVEFFREPDAHLGFVAFDWMSMGQILTLPMILAGVIMWVWAYRRHDGMLASKDSQ